MWYDYLDKTSQCNNGREDKLKKNLYAMEIKDTILCFNTKFCKLNFIIHNIVKYFQNYKVRNVYI